MMFPGMDPATLMSLFQMMGIGGGGGAGPGAMPPLAPQPPIPNVAETGALPQSVQPAPQDQGPSMGSGGPAQPYTGPVDTSQSPGNMARQMFGFNATGPSSMRPTGGVPFGGGGMPTPPATLGEALQPAQPAPGTPMPMSRPPGLGAPGGGGGGGSPGYYGGSPANNPNLKPVGTPPGGAPPMDLQKLLGGIKSPAGPDVVKPSTPAAPARGQVGSSALMELLNALGMGGGRSMRMPTTLGQALELKPSAWGGVYG